MNIDKYFICIPCQSLYLGKLKLTFLTKEENLKPHNDEIEIDLTQTHLYVSSATSDKDFCQGTSIYDVRDSLSNDFSLKYQITVQYRFSDIKFSDNL